MPQPIVNRKSEEVFSLLRERAVAAGYKAPSFVGLCTAGCIKAVGTDRLGAMRRKAHAHNDRADEHYGWICILGWSPSKWITPTGQPTALLAHEYAHIITPNRGHDAKWKKAITDLGHPAEAARVR